ncbi:MAG: bifunctional folylpolyglutamate synthase/dihydrofolate synthase, partial [Tenuifilum sp.]
MTYQEALEYIYLQLPMFQRIGKAAYKADLGNTLKLDEYLGHPHRTFKTIHIAGTNGKGSTSHMLAAVLQKAGYRVGLYTSPHLKDFRERVRVNGKMIPENEVVSFVSKHKDFFDQIKPSFFEMTVALAFDYFSRMNLD